MGGRGSASTRAQAGPPPAAPGVFTPAAAAKAGKATRTVTLPDGSVEQRTSRSEYTHATIVQIKGGEYDGQWTVMAWHSRRDLASKTVEDVRRQIANGRAGLGPVKIAEVSQPAPVKPARTKKGK